MSQTEPREPKGQVEPVDGSAAGAGKGSPALTVPNQRKNNVPTMPGLNGGTLNAGGTPGNKGGSGRPADKVRRDATESLENHVSRIGTLMGQTVGLAESEIAKGSGMSVNSLTALLNQVAKLANTLTSIGPGTKVTNVLEAGEWIAWVREELESEGVPPTQVTRVLKSLQARMGA